MKLASITALVPALALTLAACQSKPQDDTSTMTASASLLADAAGTYTGRNFLWLHDPNQPFEGDGTLRIEGETIRYDWTLQDKEQGGAMTVAVTDADVAIEWQDSFHAPQAMQFRGEHVADAIVVHGTYSAGDGPDWGWRIELRKPSADAVLMEMFNIHPSGHEAIAVRLEGARQP